MPLFEMEGIQPFSVSSLTAADTPDIILLMDVRPEAQVAAAHWAKVGVPELQGKGIMAGQMAAAAAALAVRVKREITPIKNQAALALNGPPDLDLIMVSVEDGTVPPPYLPMAQETEATVIMEAILESEAPAQ